MFGKQYWSGMAEGAVSTAGSGLIGSGINFLGGLADEFFEKRSLQRQVNAQKELTDYNFEKQMEFWNEQNKYNSPTAQMSRLREAGLNPAMLNGNAVNTQAGGLSSVGVPAPSGHRPNSIGAPQLGMLAQIAQSMAQTGFIDEETRLVTQKILSEILERDIKEIAKLLDIEEYEIRKMDKEALYEAYYGTGIDGGEIRIKDNPISTQIAEARQRIKESQSQEAYNIAVTATENKLRDLRAQRESLTNDEISSRISNIRLEHRKLSEDIDSMSRANAISSSYRVIGNFYGLETLEGLPPELIAKASEYYRDFLNGEFTYDSTIEAFQQIVNKYAEKDIHISTSISEAEDTAINVFGASSKKGYKISYSH